jgi:hypothetical protein
MGTSMFLVAFILAPFPSAIMFALQVSLIYAVLGTVFFMLIQYLVGPAVVARSTRLRYLGKGENPWLEKMVKAS